MKFRAEIKRYNTLTDNELYGKINPKIYILFQPILGGGA